MTVPGRSATVYFERERLVGRRSQFNPLQTQCSLVHARRQGVRSRVAAAHAREVMRI